jgi:hypothetical protein
MQIRCLSLQGKLLRIGNARCCKVQIGYRVNVYGDYCQEDRAAARHERFHGSVSFRWFPCNSLHPKLKYDTFLSVRGNVRIQSTIKPTTPERIEPVAYPLMVFIANVEVRMSLPMTKMRKLSERLRQIRDQTAQEAPRPHRPYCEPSQLRHQYP